MTHPHSMAIDQQQYSQHVPPAGRIAKRRRTKAKSAAFSFTSAQITALTEASVALQLARPDLAAALGEMLFHSSSTATAKTSRKPKQSFRVQPSPAASMMEQTPIFPASHSSNSSDANQFESLAPNNQRSGSALISDEPNLPFFAAAMLPRQIAECFASFVPDMCEPSLSLVEIDEPGSDLESFEGHVKLTEK